MTGGMPISRRTYGSAPTWSSCPCVRTIASMSSARSRRVEKSGRTRSMPSMSAVGNISPVSTTTIRPSNSTAVMFFPISPSPPRGRMRTLEPLKLGGAPGQQPVGLEYAPDLGPLFLVRLDDRDRVDLGDHLVDRPQLLVDFPGSTEVSRLDRVVDLAHLGADDVRGDQDPARLPHLQCGKEGAVIPGEDAKTVDGAELVVVRLLHRDHVLDRGQLGELCGREVDHHPRRDVVEDHRNPGRLRDRLVVKLDPGEA